MPWAIVFMSPAEGRAQRNTGWRACVSARSGSGAARRDASHACCSHRHALTPPRSTARAAAVLLLNRCPALRTQYRLAVQPPVGLQARVCEDVCQLGDAGEQTAEDLQMGAVNHQRALCSWGETAERRRVAVKG